MKRKSITDTQRINFLIKYCCDMQPCAGWRCYVRNIDIMGGPNYITDSRTIDARGKTWRAAVDSAIEQVSKLSWVGDYRHPKAK